MCSRYIKSFRAMRLNYREEKLKERKLRDLQLQEDKTMGIWAKRQLRIELQIAPKQSPLQRARRIRNKRQEEINRIHCNIADRGTEYKSCEKRLTKRLSKCHDDRELETRMVKSSLALPEEEEISRSNSSISLPLVPTKKQTHTRRNSLPMLPQHPPAMPSYINKKSPSLPTIGGNNRTSQLQPVSQQVTSIKSDC